MSDGSGKESGQRRWWHFQFARASLVPGFLVVVLSLFLLQDSIQKEMRPISSGAAGPNLSMLFLVMVLVASIPLGSAFAFAGLLHRPRRLAMTGLALNLGCPLLCYVA